MRRILAALTLSRPTFAMAGRRRAQHDEYPTALPLGAPVDCDVGRRQDTSASFRWFGLFGASAHLVSRSPAPSPKPFS